MCPGLESHNFKDKATWPAAGPLFLGHKGLISGHQGEINSEINMVLISVT